MERFRSYRSEIETRANELESLAESLASYEGLGPDDLSEFSITAEIGPEDPGRSLDRASDAIESQTKALVKGLEEQAASRAELLARVGNWNPDIDPRVVSYWASSTTRGLTSVGAAALGLIPDEKIDLASYLYPEIRVNGINYIADQLVRSGGELEADSSLTWALAASSFRDREERSTATAFLRSIIEFKELSEDPVALKNRAEAYLIELLEGAFEQYPDGEKKRELMQRPTVQAAIIAVELHPGGRAVVLPNDLVSLGKERRPQINDRNRLRLDQCEYLSGQSENDFIAVSTLVHGTAGPAGIAVADVTGLSAIATRSSDRSIVLNPGDTKEDIELKDQMVKIWDSVRPIDLTAHDAVEHIRDHLGENVLGMSADSFKAYIERRLESGAFAVKSNPGAGANWNGMFDISLEYANEHQMPVIFTWNASSIAVVHPGSSKEQVRLAMETDEIVRNGEKERQSREIVDQLLEQEISDTQELIDWIDRAYRVGIREEDAHRVINHLESLGWKPNGMDEEAIFQFVGRKEHLDISVDELDQMIIRAAMAELIAEKDLRAVDVLIWGRNKRIDES